MAEGINEKPQVITLQLQALGTTLLEDNGDVSIGPGINPRILFGEKKRPEDRDNFYSGLGVEYSRLQLTSNSDQTRHSGSVHAIVGYKLGGRHQLEANLGVGGIITQRENESRFHYGLFVGGQYLYRLYQGDQQSLTSPGRNSLWLGAKVGGMLGGATRDHANPNFPGLQSSLSLAWSFY